MKYVPEGRVPLLIKLHNASMEKAQYIVIHHTAYYPSPNSVILTNTQTMMKQFGGPKLCKYLVSRSRI